MGGVEIWPERLWLSEFWGEEQLQHTLAEASSRVKFSSIHGMVGDFITTFRVGWFSEFAIHEGERWIMEC